MSKENPKKAVAALLSDVTTPQIRPMTLGVYAALERIGSPMVTGTPAKDTLDLVPSLYLLTHDPREVLKGDIVDLALQWADTQPVHVIADIRKAALKQMRDFLNVVPESDGAKKKRTAGSPSGVSGRREPMAGRSTKSSGACRSARSRSSAGKTNSERNRLASSLSSRSKK